MIANVRNNSLDSETQKRITDKLHEKTMPFLKEIGKIVNKENEKNPLELSESVTTMFCVIIGTLSGDSALQSCIMTAHRLMTIEAMPMSKAGFTRAVRDEKRPDYLG